MIKSRIAVVACLMSLALGCGRENSAPSSITLTNTVEVVREVVVTNRVTVAVAVTNVVTVERAPERILSARKTSPCAVSSDSLDAARLRKLLSDSGARVISCSAGSTAVVEAPEKALATLQTAGIVSVRELPPQEKMAQGIGEAVSIIPLSSIDLPAIADAVRSQGGKLVQVVTIGRARIRAKMPLPAVRKLAARGDVLKIERDEP